MVKKVLVYTALIMLYFHSAAMAVPITGDITFGSTLNPAVNLATTNSLPVAGPTFITSVSGDFSGPLAAGGLATLNSFVFNPLSAGTTVWTAGPFSFKLDTVNIVSQNSLTLALSGTGFMSALGFDSTFYEWGFSADRTRNVVALSMSNSPAVVPEPGSLLLLGTGVLLIVGSKLRAWRNA